MFGWTARHAVHWIVSLIGVTILVAANFLIFQCVFVYLPLSYPKYAASLFAANDLSRSMFAAACKLGPAAAWDVAKTLTNCWHTSGRGEA